MKKIDDGVTMSRTLRDIVLDADAGSLIETVSELGIDPADLASRGRAAAERALASTARSAESITSAPDMDATNQLHEGLSVLLHLLRRRDNLSEEDLAARARVDVTEVRRIEHDRTYTPSPRTVYQLEQVFRLPKRTLVKLSGLARAQSPEFKDEVLRFAASSRAIQKMTREERKLLNEFVRFLSLHTDSPEGE